MGHLSGVLLMGLAGFPSRLRRAFRAFEDRLGRDLTQTELGEMVGKQLKEGAISQQSVARWFAGTLPEHARMVALAEVLGVDPGWLSYGSGEKDAPMRDAPPATEPVVRPDPGNALDVSGFASPRKHRKSDGNTG
jgi:transcriptional regulator with XRE-family HTH domain